MRQYEDFDLSIESSDEGLYRVRVLDSPAGQADGSFSLPFESIELENFLLKIGRHRGGVRRLESFETEAAREFGDRLFDAVFAGDIGTQFRRSLDAVERDERGLRIRLRLADAPELNEIPWEFLHSKATDRFVVLSSWTPLVRYVSLDRGAEPLTISPPLRVLAMVSSPTDYPTLDVEAEWARLDESLGEMAAAGLVEVTRLDRATLRELQRALRRSDDHHIFHFIGHGGYDERADDGVLLLEDDNGRAREVSGHSLGTILGDARTIRLAVLNSCEGARSSVRDPFAGAAQSLVFAGIDAVVAMQFEISDRAAIVFAHEFYAAIADGFPVDAALSEARRAIFGASPDVEWGTPVLHMRSENGQLFDLVGEPTPPSQPSVTDRPPLPDTLVENDVDAGLRTPAEIEAVDESPAAPTAEPQPVAPEHTAPDDMAPADSAPEYSAPEDTASLDTASEEPVSEDPVSEDPVSEDPAVEDAVAVETRAVADQAVAAETPPPVEAFPSDDTAAPAAEQASDGGETPHEETQPLLEAPPVHTEGAPVGVRRGSGVLVKLGIGLVVAVLVVFALTRIVGGGESDATLAPVEPTALDDPVATTVADVATTVADVATTAAPLEVQVIDTPQVTSRFVGANVAIDGDLGEWTFVTEEYVLRHPIFRQSGVAQLGSDSPGTVRMFHDATALFVAVSVADDIYSQANTGNQIWRGDAFDINLSLGDPADTQGSITGSEFQLTITPRNADGEPSAVLFGAGDAGRFGPNTTSLPVVAAGAVSGGGAWVLEAAIPWTTFGLEGAPSGELAAIFAVFDNDGELGSDGRPAQTVILANTPGAGFQVPNTWGRLTLVS